MKRLTEALKWRDPWFRELSVDGKLVFFYFIDNCDAAGVWEPDYAMANFCLKRDIPWDEVWREFGDRVLKMADGKLWMRKFIEFQCGKLTETCPPHKTVIALVRKHGLSLADGVVTLSLPYRYPSVREQEEEEDKKKTDRKGGLEGNHGSKPSETSELPGLSENPHRKLPEQLRAEKLFRRRPTTPWDAACKKAWDRSKAAILATTEAEWVLLEWFYSIPPEGTYRRHDLGTLLNNWSAEIDRAQNHKNTAKPNGNHATMLPKNVREAMETKAT